MERLTKKYAIDNNLAPVKDFDKMPVKVLQFGEGNFLRAFICWMVDEMNEKAGFNGRVELVQPIETGLVDALSEQDFLYTLFLRGVQDGNVYDERRVITAVSGGINPYSEYKKYLEAAHNADLRVIVSNTTEAGITYSPENKTDKCPVTFPAKLTALMFERFKHFNGAADKGFIIIPCELIEKNGSKLKEAVLKYAMDWNLGEDFIKWLNEANAFLATLVDRVVSGYPRDEAEALTKELGYVDNFLDVGEYFHLLVIEGDKKYSKELPFTEAGLNVVWTDDMTPYRSRKVKILNGAHTTTSLAGYLAGLETVREYTEDAVLGKYLEKGIFEELVPTVHLPDGERVKYAQAVVERFKNPFVKHLCLSIALNSVSKYKVRVLPSVLELADKNGKVPAVLSFALAALIDFYNIKEHNGGTAYAVTEDGRKYPVADDDFVLKNMEEYHKTAGGNMAKLSELVLKDSSFWGQDLTKVADYQAAVTAHLESIKANGIKEAIRKLV